jgi:hypothetical protein
MASFNLEFSKSQTLRSNTQEDDVLLLLIFGSNIRTRGKWIFIATRVFTSSTAPWTPDLDFLHIFLGPRFCVLSCLPVLASYDRRGVACVSSRILLRSVSVRVCVGACSGLDRRFLGKLWQSDSDNTRIDKGLAPREVQICQPNA